MEEYFANKIIQLCGKQHETEVTKLGKCAELNLNQWQHAVGNSS